jgi:hypothetical protein
MQNSKRLKDLGIIVSSIYSNNSGRTKNKPHCKSNEDSGSEYDPSHDDDAKVLILLSFQGFICCLLQDWILFYPYFHSRRDLRRRLAEGETHKVQMALVR